MKPEEDGLEEVRERLRAELDALPLAAPHASQARYRGPVPVGSSLRRLGPALAGAAVAVFLIGFAAAALNPSIWRSHGAGSTHQVGQPAGFKSPSPSQGATPAASPTAAPHQTPEPESTASGDRSGEPSPEPSATPEADSSSAGTDGGSGDGGSSPAPVASPTPDR